MNVLFLTLLDFSSLEERNIYTDLLREFVKNGDEVYAVSPLEARRKKETYLIEEPHCTILKQKIGNIQKTNVIEKGISTITLENKIVDGIKRYFNNIHFDLILYSTPPITLISAIEYVKNRDCARTYLLLKDIFPQNAVDLGMLNKTGLKGLIYKYFRNKEKKLYALSDSVGCMSWANVKYVIEHNPEIDPHRVGICPNSVDVVEMNVSEEQRRNIRNKYGLPVDKTIFVYGGNLGKPQGIPFIIRCLTTQLSNDKAFFLIVGKGTEAGVLEKFFFDKKPSNMKQLTSLPKEDYDQLVAACDVGMIFLDYRFTIPNFPSRLLGYMQAKLPVLAVTDTNTDVGRVIADAGFGWWGKSNDVADFENIVEMVLRANLPEMGKIGFDYLEQNYNVKLGYEIIKNNVVTIGNLDRSSISH